jgi:two-component system, NarL family, response regulator LiaR
MIHVLIVDDHHHMRRNVRRLLQQEPGIQVVDEASNGREGVELAQALNPDVIVMDIAMPDMDGFQAIEQIQKLGIPAKIVILSMYANLTFVRRALQQGVKGYVLKRTAVKELAQAIKTAWQGRTYLSPALADTLTDS